MRYIAALLVFFPAFVFCDNAEPLEIEDDQGLVISKVSGLPIVAGLTFRLFGAKEEFRIKAGKNRKITAKAGEYYLSRIDTPLSYPGVYYLAMPEPGDRSGMLVVKPGAVTYLGEWHFYKKPYKRRDFKYGLKVKFDVETMRSFASEYPGARALPLMIATSDGKAQQVAWPESNKPKERI